MGGRDELVLPPRRLPDIGLLNARGASIPLRQGRASPLLVLVHGDGCAECAEYLAELQEHQSEIEEWVGRVLVVTPAPEAAAAGPFTTLADPERHLAQGVGVTHPAVIVADQWGQVHAAEEAGDEHRFLPLTEVVEWLRFLAIQCPECQGEAF